VDLDKTFFASRLSYVWAVIRNLVVVLFVLILFSVAVTKFEVVVLSILLLILLHQNGFQELLRCGIYDQNLYIARLVRLALVALKSDEKYSAELQNEISRGEKVLDGAQTHHVINIAFYYFLWLVIIWKIVSIM